MAATRAWTFGKPASDRVVLYIRHAESKFNLKQDSYFADHPEIDHTCTYRLHIREEYTSEGTNEYFLICRLDCVAIFPLYERGGRSILRMPIPPKKTKVKLRVGNSDKELYTVQRSINYYSSFSSPNFTLIQRVPTGVARVYTTRWSLTHHCPIVVSSRQPN